MEKIKTSKITQIHDVSVTNQDVFGHKIKIIIKGRNSNGKLVKFTIEDSAWYAKAICKELKKAVLNFHSRATSCKDEFFNELKS